MPMYEYRCKSCGNKLEKIRRLSERDAAAECPVCGAEAERVASTFALGGGGPARTSPPASGSSGNCFSGG